MDYNKKLKYCLLSRDYSNMLQHWIDTQRYMETKFRPDIPPVEREKIEKWMASESEYLLVTGIYHWGRIFGDGFEDVWLQPEDVHRHVGEDGKVEDEIEDYDIVHINYYGLTQGLPSDVRERIGYNGKTKLVVNIDYAPALWGRCPEFKKQRSLIRDLDQADAIFATTEVMANILTHALGREIPVIPHPTAVNEVKKLMIPREKRQESTGTKAPVALINLHSWDSATMHYFPAWALFQNSEGPLDYVTMACGVNNGDQDMFEKTSILYGGQVTKMPYTRFMEYIKSVYVSIDSYSEFSYGRYCLDCACLGVPNIGYAPVESQSHLFPELTTGIFDVKKQYELLKKLRYDTDFYDNVVSYAQKTVEEYNYKNSRRKFLDMVYGGEDG